MLVFRLATITFLFSLCPVYADVSGNHLKEALHRLGFQNVVVDQCSLSIEKQLLPSEHNGFSDKYRRLIFFNTLGPPSEAQLIPTLIDGKQEFKLVFEMEQSYRIETIWKTRVFNSWVEEQFPGQDWHHGPSSINNNSQEIEGQLRSKLLGFEQMNRWVYFTENREFSWFQVPTVFTSGNQQSLLELKRAITSHHEYWKC